MSLVLLVDDQPDLLDLYTEILDRMGHQVLGAHDGWEALARAHERRPDLVITDFWMTPGMDGVELSHQLHLDPILRDVPIILQSAAEDPHTSDVQAFLSKSCDLAEFETLVTRVLASARAHRQAQSRREDRTSSRSSSRTHSHASLGRSTSSSHIGF